jgi:hypothetical protein
VEKKDLLKLQTAELSPWGSGCSSLAGMGSGLYRRGQAMGEGESFWSPIICAHQMEQVDMPGKLRNWKFLRFLQAWKKAGEQAGKFGKWS